MKHYGSQYLDLRPLDGSILLLVRRSIDEIRRYRGAKRGVPGMSVEGASEVARGPTRKVFKNLMRLAGVEPATYRLGGGRSVQSELQAHFHIKKVRGSA